MGDEELARICREIYYKHQKAFDLIFEHRPNVYMELSSFIYDYIEQFPTIERDSVSKSYVRFITTALDHKIGRNGKGWTASNRLLLFEFQNRMDILSLKLILGPGDARLRDKIYLIANNNPSVFKGKVKSFTSQYTQIYAKELLPKGFLEKGDPFDVIQKKLASRIEMFMNDELKTIDKVLLDGLTEG